MNSMDPALSPNTSSEEIKNRHWIITSALKIIHNDRLLRIIGAILSIAAILSGIATYLALTSSDNFDDKSSRVLPLIYLDLTLMLLLSVIIAKRLVELWVERRRGAAGSRLHIQIAALFAFVAMTPGICVTIFSALFFDVGVKTWFSEPVRHALKESHSVAEAYVNENSRVVLQEAMNIKEQLAPNIYAFQEMPDLLSHYLTEWSEQKKLDEALVFDGNGEILARSALTFTLEFENLLPKAFEQAKSGEVTVFRSENNDRVRVLLKIDDDSDLFLYIGKMIDPEVLKHVIQTKSGIQEYQRLDAQLSGLQITFIMLFGVVAFLLLLASIWAGLTVANLFVRPISRLIVAAEEVTGGNLEVQVMAEGSLNNELGNLAHAFNRMIRQLSSQRLDLIKASVQIDQRRQFMEAVLSRISAGVISVDKLGIITLINRRAQELLSFHQLDHLQEIESEQLKEIAPELYNLLKEFEQAQEEVFSRQITIHRHGIVRILQSVIVRDLSKRTRSGYILTFDDVTPFLMAQKKAAWSDVARKIAHEIKNPLTPIQLAAERLKRKYLTEIHSDPQTFQRCIDTIIRQVAQIGKLVTEFSDFARMPEPVLRPENIIELVKQAIFLQRQAHPNVIFEFIQKEDQIIQEEIILDNDNRAGQTPSSEIIVNCDVNQIGQVLTNLLQNAINALTLDEFTKRKKKENELLLENSPFPSCQIRVIIEKIDTKCRITIEDNGPGFPREGRERLTEPYYTTHEKGTGLGLAIVAKIVDDHRGKLELGDSTLGGAKVVIEIPISLRRATE